VKYSRLSLRSTFKLNTLYIFFFLQTWPLLFPPQLWPLAVFRSWTWPRTNLLKNVATGYFSFTTVPTDNFPFTNMLQIFSFQVRPRIFFSFFWRNSPHWARASSFTRFLDHTQRRTTVGRTPLDEWSARHRDLYLDNTQHSQQTNIHAPPVGLEPTISAGERRQTYADHEYSFPK
jgi:hypothetical protein